MKSARSDSPKPILKKKTQELHAKSPGKVAFDIFNKRVENQDVVNELEGMLEEFYEDTATRYILDENDAKYCKHFKAS